ncbi:MAG: chromate transporter [Clostridium sp.]|nr:chromate transporter [Clostridiaceae bacterium]MDD6075008.1 chromate transporter [Clostridium sp.]MDY5483412.1 chromate transporter [Clostridium sp.]
MYKKFPVLSELALSFMKVGLFTFGGGYAMISVITDTCVEKKQWLTQDEMMELTVVAESTPGPIAINCATYVGYKMAGMPGAVLATLGIVLPSFVILYIISVFLDHYLEYKVIAAACKGIKVGVSLLILDAGFMMLKKMKKKLQPRLIASCAFVIMLLSNSFSLRISSVLLMLAAGVISLSVFAAKNAFAQKGGEGQ